MPTSSEKLKTELEHELEKLRIFEERCNNKEILWRNTSEEIRQIRNDIFMETITPILFKIYLINYYSS